MTENTNDLVEELKSHLTSRGWSTDTAEVVVDGIVESFGSDFFPEGIATYDELARNQGVGEPPPFDEKAISLLDAIKEAKK